MNFQTLFGVGLVGVVALAGGCFSPQGSSEQAVRAQAKQWRAEHRIIDLHQHLNGTTQHLARAVRVLDRVGIGVAVNLSGGYVTRGTNAASPFERVKAMADAVAPGRIVHYMNLDYTGWDATDFSARGAADRGRASAGRGGLEGVQAAGAELEGWEREADSH